MSSDAGKTQDGSGAQGAAGSDANQQGSSAAAGKTGSAADGAQGAGQGGTDPYATLALPADTVLDTDSLARVRSLAEKHKLPVEAASEVVSALHEEVSEALAVLGAAAKPDGAAWKAKVEALEALSLADPELGAGSQQKLVDKRLKAELYLNQKAPALKEKLHQAGLLADPDVLKFLNARVHDTGEDRMVHGDRRPAPSGSPSIRDRYNPDGSPKEAATTGA